MPLRKLVHLHSRSPGAHGLADELLGEWRNPSDTPGKPIIIEDGGGARPIHLYVIWADWENLEQVERSEIIMDVYEQLHGLAQSSNVTVAMGLTESEAQRLGIAYK